MFGLLKELFGIGPKVDYAELMNRNAQIIDVRSPAEFSAGHIKASINIPLDLLGASLFKIRKDVPIITCCASGARSAAAKQFLLSKGYAEVHNGGGWSGLNSKLT
ncbi:MAG: rhodanese-like domain-containing protein [Ignavibacteria bacterium]|nr:rhodanese-like domain-containing protein [Ignavibacteria bacterium]